jgi:hypothetical protein
MIRISETSVLALAADLLTYFIFWYPLHDLAWVMAQAHTYIRWFIFSLFQLYSQQSTWRHAVRERAYYFSQWNLRPKNPETQKQLSLLNVYYYYYAGESWYGHGASSHSHRASVERERGHIITEMVPVSLYQMPRGFTDPDVIQHTYYLILSFHSLISHSSGIPAVKRWAEWQWDISLLLS